ncbi:hypothetical protein K0M31_018742 [Melipona bicolor]|uniref:Uncharacterized protein n=1 Tax=Melipona bicolor TaxID=60889 RepID=A0AA40G3V6_9HYME|nr:hypothetical protein K0M31_018742 [Melipona bicolor]
MEETTKTVGGRRTVPSEFRKSNETCRGTPPRKTRGRPPCTISGGVCLACHATTTSLGPTLYIPIYERFSGDYSLPTPVLLGSSSRTRSEHIESDRGENPWTGATGE